MYEHIRDTARPDRLASTYSCLRLPPAGPLVCRDLLTLSLSGRAIRLARHWPSPWHRSAGRLPVFDHSRSGFVAFNMQMVQLSERPINPQEAKFTARSPPSLALACPRINRGRPPGGMGAGNLA